MNIKRIGFPRAFWYFYFGPAFKVFFEMLEYEVVVSPPTDRETLKIGSLSTTSDHCISAKEYLGHVGRLVGSVDAIFVPNILRTLRKWCPKLSGLGSPLTKSSSIRNLPPLLEIAVDDDSMAGVWTNLYALGLRLGHKEKLLNIAINSAKATQTLFDRLMTDGRTVDEALDYFESGRLGDPLPPLNSLLPNDALRMGVIGHRYTIGDRYISGGMLDVLRKRGCHILTQDMISKQSAAIEMAKGPFEGIFWYVEHHLVGAAYYMIRNGLVDHLFLVAAALCGTTSVIRTFIEDEARNYGVSFSYLALDEESEAGIDTRIVTPVEVMAYNVELTRKNALPVSIISQLEQRVPTGVHSSHKSLVVTMPAWGHLTPVLTGVIARTGTRVIAPPPLRQEDRQLANRIMPEEICYPASLTAMSIKRGVELGANAVVGIGTRIGWSGPCRLDGYSELHKAAMSRLGHSELEWLTIHAPSTDWPGFKSVLRRITSNAGWCKTVRELVFGVHQLSVCDEIDRMTCYLRPREALRGSADELRDRYLALVYSASGFSQLKVVRTEAIEAFRSAHVYDVRPPKVHIGGEIYIATEPFANEYVERELGALGLEVYNDLSVGEWFKQHILGWFYPSLVRAHDLKVDMTKDMCQKVGGHGRETIAALMLAIESGADGFVQVAPAFCMPETTVLDALLEVSRLHGYFPVLVERHDVHEESSRGTCRETFVFQLAERKEAVL